MLKFLRKKIGIIGYGNMGAAIAEGIKDRYRVITFDKDSSKLKCLSGISAAKSASGVVDRSDLVLLAVKPQEFGVLLNEIKGCLKDKLVISIAAGITTSYIEGCLGQARVVRIMPNIGVKIGRAESVLCKGKYAAKKDIDLAKRIFDLLGKTWIIEEDMFDSATAISGSGPAYIYYDMEARKIDPLRLPKEKEIEYARSLSEAARRVGFDLEFADELSAAVTASAISLTLRTAISPVELRRQITSKGGTTEAAVKILAEGGSWAEAAVAAKERAKQLSGG
ncbi:MAG: pyrroline-5-carboxylate reductase [Candidatus Omnitrophota bacterium]|jgi:pyrroline-5-carboxylate reductase